MSFQFLTGFHGLTVGLLLLSWQKHLKQCGLHFVGLLPAKIPINEFKIGMEIIFLERNHEFLFLF